MIFFSSVHQFYYSLLLSQWILHPLHNPEHSVTSGRAGTGEGIRETEGGSTQGKVRGLCGRLCSHIWMGNGTAPAMWTQTSLNPSLQPHFFLTSQMLYCLQQKSKCLFFQGLPCRSLPSSINTEAKLLEFITPCPSYPHLHQESVLGAWGRVGKMPGLLT